MSYNDDKIIERVAYVRKNNGMSINGFAKKCGIDAGNLSRSLAGTSSFSERVLFKISQAMNISLDWLEKGVGKMCTDVVDDKQLNELFEEEPKNAPQNEEGQIIEVDVKALMRENDLLKQLLQSKNNEIELLRKLLGNKNNKREKGN